MDKAQAILEQANELLKQQKWAGVLELCEQAVEVYPRALKNGGFHVQKGSALSGLGKVEDALECFDKAVQLEPKNAAAWFKKGSALKAMKRLEEAADAFERTVNLNEKMEPAWINLVRVQLKLKRYAAAFQASSDSLPFISPKNKFMMKKLILMSCTQGGKQTEAKELCIEMAQLVQRNRLGEDISKDFVAAKDLDSQFIALLASTLARIAQATKEPKFWQLASMVDPTLETILGLGVCHLDRGELEEARRTLLLAKSLSPKDWRPFHHLGVIAFKEKRFRISAGYFRFAFDLCASTPPTSPSEKRPTVAFLDPTLHAEGQSRMKGEIQLHLGTALLNGGNQADARHHISCAAHSLGPARNPARILLAFLDCAMPESAMNTLNIARREIDEMAFEHTVVAPKSSQLVGNYSTSQLRDIALRLHKTTANLAELAFLDCKSQRRDEQRISRVLELEKSCYNDLLRRKPGSKTAKKGLAENEIRIKELTAPKAKFGNGKEHSQGNESNTAEKLRRALVKASSSAEFIKKLQARRARVEHDIGDHDNESSQMHDNEFD